MKRAHKRNIGPQNVEPENTTKDIIEPRNTHEPEKSMENITEPEKAMENITEPEKAMENITESEKAMENITEPETAMQDITESETAMENITEPEKEKISQALEKNWKYYFNRFRYYHYVIAEKVETAIGVLCLMVIKVYFFLTGYEQFALQPDESSNTMGMGVIDDD